MTQFKEKSGKHKERASVGLYTYPVLRAADILLYKATEVPVGEDQKQHLELTRDIAAKFNNDFGVPGFFPQPEPLIQGPGTRVMSLRDGAAKMSKSDPSDLSRINLTDDADTIAAKIKKAKSDMDVLPDMVEGLDGRPEAKNLVAIYAALSDTTREAVLAEFGGQGFGSFKPRLAELAVTSMAPVTAEMRRLHARSKHGYITKEAHIQWQKSLAKKGWLAPNWPEEYGGPGFTQSQKYIFNVEMGRAGVPHTIPFGPTMVAPVIMKFGSPEQKKRFLPDILETNVLWCQGYSEPGSGSDLAPGKIVNRPVIGE